MTDWVISAPSGELHPTFGGNSLSKVAAAFAPEPKELKKMLLDMRRRHRWSQEFTATLLGVSPSTVRKWESGDRQPSGASAKLLFLLHAQFTRSDKVKNAWDLATWGAMPCRTDKPCDLPLELDATHFVPFKEIMEEVNAALAAARVWAARKT